MRTEALKRLFEAFTAIESIERFIANSTLDQYLDNELIQSAVERKLEFSEKPSSGLQKLIPAFSLPFRICATLLEHAIE